MPHYSQQNKNRRDAQTRMNKVIDVQIGQVKAGQGKVILKSKAIGSCIAIVAYDAARSIGALAHVMLPGSAPAGRRPDEETKYAANAIDSIVAQIASRGSKSNDIEAVLVGGANVLDRKNDTICKDNIESVLELLEKKRIKVKARAVGGTNRRSVSLDIERGTVSYTEGDSSEMQLWPGA